MIKIKDENEIALMRAAGEIIVDLFAELERMIEPGVSAYTLEQFSREFIEKRGAIPGFLGYNGYPATLCVSIDDEVVHGIPTREKVLKEGMIVGIDVGVKYQGYYADAARTYAVGKVNELKKRLMEVTREALEIAIKNAYQGNRLGTLSYRVQSFVESNGFSVVREYVGHGIGSKLHEEPQVPNYGVANTGVKLLNGMTLAIEPMVNAGTYKTKVKSDGWTVVTEDGQPSAHFEDTVAIFDNKTLILTR